ncbi:MAG: hypothetical protein GX580_00910 [Candidatus Hydrogenedens sp.]|nr:hypothetical protein [Candidatus Hydrogenedentota bacterium]NLF56180.1 hypothetical protein [Candidatus Hydrogenedens sp.]
MRFGINWTVLAVLTLLVGAGCSQPAQKEFTGERQAAPGAPLAELDTGAETKPVPTDVGDVESSIVFSATATPGILPEQVSVDEMMTARGRMAMCTITVRPPYPASLMVRLTLEPQREFADTPVVLRGHAYRDEAPLSPGLATVIGANAPPPSAAPQMPVTWQRTFDVDVMQGLATPPDSMLVVGRLDAYLTSPGTPENSLDPATAESAKKTQLLSSPVRINFVK